VLLALAIKTRRRVAIVIVFGRIVAAAVGPITAMAPAGTSIETLCNVDAPLESLTADDSTWSLTPEAVPLVAGMPAVIPGKPR
jgi:hypothetical protein